MQSPLLITARKQLLIKSCFKLFKVYIKLPSFYITQGIEEFKNKERKNTGYADRRRFNQRTTEKTAGH